MWSFCNRIFLTLSACFIVTLAMAQPKNNSPFSRFGLGDVLNQNFANLRATPGLTNAYNNAYHLNLQNPASLGFMQMAAFDFGLYGRNSTWESNSPTNGPQTNENWSGNLSHLALGFTLNNPINDLLDREVRNFSWGMSLALVPYSLVGFTVQTEGEVPNIGNVISEFRGEGGTNQFLWSNGFRYKQTAVGFSLGYLFGKIENTRGVIFEDLVAGFQDRFVDDFSINGFTWRFGAQHNFIFNQGDAKKVKVLTLGVTASSNSSLNTSSSQFFTRFNPSYVTALSNDTIVNTSEISGSATLPGHVGVGVVYAGGAKFKIGVNYDQTFWSNYRNDAKPETFDDAYRIGAFIGTDPRSIDGEQLEERGITFGFGLPVTLPRRQVSFINLSAEFGKWRIYHRIYFKR